MLFLVQDQARIELVDGPAHNQCLQEESVPCMPSERDSHGIQASTMFSLEFRLLNPECTHCLLELTDVTGQSYADQYVRDR